MHGALPPDMMGIKEWPKVPVQVHYASEDPWVESDHVSALSAAVAQSGGACSVYTYKGSAHLFADNELADYDQRSAETMISRILEFLDDVESGKE